MDILLELIDIPKPSYSIDDPEILDLAGSIEEHGLSHPIIVRSANISGRFILVSGERRYLAYKKMGWNLIPGELRDVTEEKGVELRIHENLKRRNLPWYEQAEQVALLHELRQKEHGVTDGPGRPKGGVKSWGIRETAEELGIALGPLAEDLQLARAVRLDPSLRNIKDKKTAVRLVKQAAQRRTSELEAGMPTQIDVNEVYCSDSVEVLKRLPDRSIDHAFTDPPWIKFFESSYRLDDRTLPVFKELFRVLKGGAFCYIVCGLDDYIYYVGFDSPDPKNPGETTHTAGALEKIGYNVSKTPLIWVKKNSLSRRGVKSWEYDRDFEFIIVAVKGSPALTESTTISSIKEHAVVPVAHLIHPNEKPVSLVKQVLGECSYEGNIIIDPFGGSGVTAQACIEMKRRYIVIERDRKAYEKICKRLGREA